MGHWVRALGSVSYNPVSLERDREGLLETRVVTGRKRANVAAASA